MAKYPFMTYVNDHMRRMKGACAETTWNNLFRRYRRMNKDIKKLHDEKKISTNSPKKMTVDDVHAYLMYRRSLNLSSKENSHDESALKKLFKFVRNKAFDECLLDYPILKVRKKNVRLPSMDDKTYRKILEISKTLEPNDYRRHRAYCLVLLCARSGARTKEIQFAEIHDLDTKDWTFDIIHVKGEDTYGEPRNVPINPEIRHIIESYLRLREERLIAESGKSTALFPSNQSEDGFLAANTLRKIKSIVEVDIGEKFDFRKLRRTFGQQLVDANVDIESVSVAMGHSTTKTTEMSYARRRSEAANAKIKSCW